MALIGDNNTLHRLIRQDKTAGEWVTEFEGSMRECFVKYAEKLDANSYYKVIEIEGVAI